MAEEERWFLLGKLKRVVKKITFLLNFNVNKLKLFSVIGASSSSTRRLSFGDRPGLTACVDDPDQDTSGDSRSLNGSRLTRTMSYPSSEDDIDKRADAFIAKFHEQLRFERQISLELRYCRGNSFN